MVGETIYRSKIQSPIGSLVLVSTEKGLAAVGFGKGAKKKIDDWMKRVFRGAEIRPAESLHRVFASQLEEYFAGRRRVFHLRLDLRGSEFQKAVWSEVARIPLGRTATYGEIAHLVGRPAASPSRWGRKRRESGIHRHSLSSGYRCRGGSPAAAEGWAARDGFLHTREF